MRALRENRRNLAAMLGLLVVAVLVGGYILVQQRFPLPWIDTYEVKAELVTAQAVTPGQGQQVFVAGVAVGDVTNVDLVDGRAVVTMAIKKDKLDSVGRDAKVLLRPKTPLQDMSIDLDPGPPGAPSIGGATLPVANSQASVNLDEVLSGLDTDTRAYLRIMISSFGQGLGKRGVNLRRTFAATAPSSTQLARLDDTLKSRRGELRSLVSRLRVLTGSLADQRTDLQRLIAAGNATFTTVAAEQAPLRLGLARLPGTLAKTQTTVDTVGPLFTKLTRTAKSATPLARELTPTLRRLGRFSAGATPTVDELRGLVSEAQPVATQLRSTLAQLRPVPGAIQPTLEAARDTINELSFVPGGDQHSYSYWLAWFGHNANSLLSTQDANGPAWRTVAVVGCTNVVGVRGLLDVIAPQLSDQICPASPGSR